MRKLQLRETLIRSAYNLRFSQSHIRSGLTRLVQRATPGHLPLELGALFLSWQSGCRMRLAATAIQLILIYKRRPDAQVAAVQRGSEPDPADTAPGN